MSQTVITSAFEQLKAQQAANGGVVILDEFVFANVPGLNITDPIDRAEQLPDASMIVHRQDVGKTGMVNNNAVVYSVVMGADVGDFAFNWVGLVSKSTGVVAMIVHAPEQKKFKTTAGQQGNVLTRSFLMEYNGASEQTQIITPADTWQIDFTARMNGIDERVRLENKDTYGSATFFNNGFRVIKTGSVYSVTKGAGYVEGLRAELLFDQGITVNQLPVKVWADVCWKGTLTSVWDASVKISVAATLENYHDNDELHYVVALAEIGADGEIVDLRKSGDNQSSGLIAEINLKQPLHPTLTALASLDTGENTLPFFSGEERAGQTPFTQVGRDIVGSESADNIVEYIGLAAQDGLLKIGQCADLKALRKIKFTREGQQVFLKEHTKGQAAGGGIWYCHSLINNNNYVDDNGCQIINDYGQVIRRKDLRLICSDLFGLMHGGDVIECQRNMYKASRTFSIEEALIAKLPYGQYYLGDTRSDGSNGFVADCSDGMNFTVRGLSVGHNGPVVYHKGNGVLMRIRRDHNNSKDFWVTGGFECLRIFGKNDSLSGNNTYAGAIPFQASDMWGSLFKDLIIFGYENNKQGAAFSLYNETAWTEKARFDNVMVRGSVVGLKLHRNTAPGSTATNSFFTISGQIDMNAGVSNPCSYVLIGDGTEAGACAMYSGTLTIRGWMSRSAWHTGLDITDYSYATGKYTFIWDGYGIASDATTEVLHIIRARGANARFDGEVTNLSGQAMNAKLDILQLIWNSCIYTLESTAVGASLDNNYPVIRAKGMRINFKGKFSVQEQISGKVYTLNHLLPNQKLKITLYSHQGDKYRGKALEWKVTVQGPDFPCEIIPQGSNAGATTALNLSNGQPDNNTNYLANSGRKLMFVLPENKNADKEMPYSVEIEVL